MKTLFVNIKELLQIREPGISKVSGADMKILPTIKNAWLLVDKGKIKNFGTMDSCPKLEVDQKIDASGKIILPSWVDPHTHLVYSGNREQEFVDRINGLSYEEIAKRGGGIINSAKMLQHTSEEELYQESERRLIEIIKTGTGAVEIKSGYGLTMEAELKMLRVIRKLKQNYPIAIKSSFLGLHALPLEFKTNREEYVDKVINDMLPNVIEQNLADFVDVFCEKGYFSVKDTERILKAGAKYGLKGKIHVNQFHAIGGVQVGVAHNVKSVDHLEVMTQEDINCLKNTETMPTALPSCSLFLGIPYTPARKMIDANLPLALATDYNPGSTPSGNMNLVVSLACIKMKLTPEEAINAATLNSAYAMDLSSSHGSITKGKIANLILTEKIPSYGFLPYSFGNNHIEKVFIAGEEFKG